MFLILAQSSTVGNATTRSVHVREGWHWPRGGVGLGYVSPEESNDNGSVEEEDSEEVQVVYEMNHVSDIPQDVEPNPPAKDKPDECSDMEHSSNINDILGCT